MNKLELEKALELLAITAGKDRASAEQIYASIPTILQDSGTGKMSFPALDPNWDKPGGFAFLWSDVLDIGEIVETLLKAGLGEQLFPNQLAEVAVALVKNWSRIRKVRVELNEDEFKVVLAAKQGFDSFRSIADSTKLPEPRVQEICTDLAKREYGDKINVIHLGKDGKVATPF